MVIEPLKLEAINRTLLNANAYEPRDARQVSGFLYGNQAVALAQIAYIALKYADSQVMLKSMKEDLEESYDYYRGKGSRQRIEENVSGEVHLAGNVVDSVTLICHPDFLKSLPFVNAIQRTEYTITIKVQDLSVVLTHFKECGVKCTELRKYLKDKGIKDAMLKTQKTDIEFEEGKVKLEKVSARIVSVICEPSLQSVVREIKGFKVGKSKHLEVPIAELMTLYTKFCSFAREQGIELDLEDFKNYVDLTIHEGQFTASAVRQGLNIFLKIEYHPIINECLLNTPTMNYVEAHATWIFHKRYVGKVIESLTATNLNINLATLQEIQDNIDLEYEMTAVDLLDWERIPALQNRPPWTHQINGAKRILDSRRILLADEMGSGKTFTTILAALSVGIGLGSGPLVIVCPSALKLNWVKEIRQIDKTSSICVAEGDEIFKANWIIINYDILDRHTEELISYQPKFIAYDESHKIKSITVQGVPGSTRARHSIILSQFAPYVVSLTGTPMPKGPIDLFNQFKLIDHPLSDDFIFFGTYYCDGKISKNGWNFEGSSNEEELHELLQDCMIRNRKEDCLDLPAKLQTFMPVKVDLTKYRQAVNDYMEAREIHQRAYAMVLVGQMKKYLAYSKIKATLDLVEQVLENDDNIVVFSDYTAVIDTLSNALNEKYKGVFTRKIAHEDGSYEEHPINVVAETITGKDSSQRKFEKCEAFQSGMHKVLICNMKAGGVGLNMTRANKLVFNDLTWLPDDMFQAEDRIHRGGQTQKVEIVYLIASEAEIDAKLGDVIEKRSKMSATIIDGGESKGRQADVMKGVLRYLEEVNTHKRKPGDFVVDDLDDSEELEFEDDLFNDDNGDFEGLEFADDELPTAQMEGSRTISATGKTVEDVKESANKYPCIENGVYVNPPHTLSVISREPLIYQYTKQIPEQGITLALQMRFVNQQLAFMMLERNEYTGNIVNLKYNKASQVCGKLGECDEVGTHIHQHITKIDNYLAKGNLPYAKATTTALQTKLMKYIK